MGRKLAKTAILCLVTLAAGAGVWRWSARQPDGGPAAAPSAGPPQRIVAMAPSTTEIVFALGAGHRVVGVSRFCTHPPAVAGVPTIGGQHDPDLEQIVALRPDLVVLRGAGAALRQVCREHGIRIYEDPSQTLADVHQAIGELGALLGRGDEAEALNARLHRDLDAVAARVAGRPRPRVLLTMRGPERLMNIHTVGGTPFLSELIQIAGGRNVFADLNVDYGEVSVEEILARSPEVIVEAMPGLDLDDEQRAAVAGQWQALGPLPAVEQGRVHVLTADHLLLPSPRVTHTARLLAALFHPGASADE